MKKESQKMKKTNQSNKQETELFVVNGRVYRKNGAPKDNTQNYTPAGTSRNTSYNESGNNQTHKATNETGCCWVFYLVVYVVVAAILAAAGAGVAALAWPLAVGIIVFIAGLIVYCFKG